MDIGKLVSMMYYKVLLYDSLFETIRIIFLIY